MLKQDSQAKLIIEFQKLETHNKFSDLIIKDRRVWEHIRIKIVNVILIDKEIISKTIINKKKLNILKTLLYLKSIFHLFRISKSKIHIFTNPRRIYNKFKKIYEDPYTDPWINKLNYDYILFEKRNFNAHLKPVNNKIVYLDFIDLLILIITKIYNVNIKKSEFNFIKKIEKDIKEKFKANIDLKKIIKNELKKIIIEEYLYYLFFKITKPKYLILVCSYGKENIINAAKRLGVKVIEIQHGVFNQYHLGYHYPEFLKKSFPDYFIAFGEYWINQADLPIRDSNILIAGFPYLESIKKNLIHSRKENQIVVVSQGQIGQYLVKFICDFAQLNKEVKIIYKLHPGEVNGWKKTYPLLYKNRNRIEIVDNNMTSIYDLLIKSKWQIGVNSTSIFEGLYLGCKAYVVDLPGISYMENLIKRGIVTLVRSPDEINLDDNHKITEPVLEELFKSGSEENVICAIDSIIKK